MRPEIISISIRGDAGSGKTLLLRALLEMMADAGLLTTTDTRSITENPAGFFAAARQINEEKEELVVIAIDKPSLLAHHLATLEV